MELDLQAELELQSQGSSLKALSNKFVEQTCHSINTKALPPA